MLRDEFAKPTFVILVFLVIKILFLLLVLHFCEEHVTRVQLIYKCDNYYPKISHRRRVRKFVF
jgi:hypothetical protein